MSFQSFFLATVALAVAAPLVAQEPEPTPTAAVPAPKKPRPICRQVGRSGSHLVKRLCHSAEEWAAIDAAQSDSPQRNRVHD